MHSKAILANCLQGLPTVPFDMDDTIESCLARPSCPVLSSRMSGDLKHPERT